MKNVLKQVASVTVGHVFRSGIKERSEGDNTVVQLRNLSPLRTIKWQDCAMIGLDASKRINWLRPGDVLVPSRGASCLPVLVDDEAARRRAVAAPPFFVVRSKMADLAPAYLAWWLAQRPVQRHLEQNLQGSVVRGISRIALEQAPITVPPLAEQERIAALSHLIQQEEVLLRRFMEVDRQIMGGIAQELAARPQS